MKGPVKGAVGELPPSSAVAKTSPFCGANAAVFCGWPPPSKVAMSASTGAPVTKAKELRPAAAEDVGSGWASLARASAEAVLSRVAELSPERSVSAPR